MEDILDELRERAEDVPVPLEEAEHDQIVEAQEQILMPLPKEFIQFLLETGDIVCGSIEPVTVADPYSHTYMPEVTSTAWQQGMPREMVAVCDSREGYYCIAQDGEIKLWRDGEFDEQTWENIWYWARDVWLAS